MLASLHFRVPAVWAALFWALLTIWPTDAGARTRDPLTYELEINDPTSRYLEVTVTVTGNRRKNTELAMPAWTPGSYKIRDFARHIYGWRAERLDGSEIPVKRIDKQTWQIENRRKDFRFRYRVWANELGVRTSYIDDRFAFLNGASVFVYVVGQTERGAEVRLHTPENWPVHTPLGKSERGFVARDYDELVDSPLLLGAAQVRKFEVADTKFEYVFMAPSGSNADVDKLATEAEKIVRAAGKMMGGLPFERYVFLMVADAAGGGGLEHANSTGIILQPWSFDDDSGYRSARSVTAHEFIHAWNVKRIHDRVLGPFDYSREVYSELLWFHEGVTSTLGARALLAAELTQAEDYVTGLGSTWQNYLRRPGRNAEPLSQVGRDAWIKGYRPAKNHRNATVSYYTKGNLVGVALDLELFLGAKSHGRRGSIDGLFRRLWKERPKNARDRAITLDDIIAAASAEAGKDMSDFFARYVMGVEELPLPALLEKVGIKVERTPEARDAKMWSGIVGSGARIDSVAPDSPAQRAGLMLGDEIIAVDGSRVRSIDEAKQRLAAFAPKKNVQVTLFRRGRLEERALVVGASPHETWSFSRPEGGASWPVSASR